MKAITGFFRRMLGRLYGEGYHTRRLKRLGEPYSSLAGTLGAFHDVNKMMEKLQPEYWRASEKFGAQIIGKYGITKGKAWAMTPEMALEKQMQTWLDTLNSSNPTYPEMVKRLMLEDQFLPGNIKRTVADYFSGSVGLAMVGKEMEDSYERVFGKKPQLVYQRPGS